MPLVSVDDVRGAYRKLKTFVYYDKTDLQLRLRLAEFECDPKFEHRLVDVAESLNSAEIEGDSKFSRWLSEVDFRIVPKSSDQPLSAKVTAGNFISNDTSSKTHTVTRVNYMFDGPIELHLIAVLWIIREGRHLDERLGPECFGSRLETGLGDSEDKSNRLFKKYHELYTVWRDSGITKARDLLTLDQQSVFVLGLDIQQYYYHVRIDFDVLARSVSRARGELPTRNGASKILQRLRKIYSTFTARLLPLLRMTHGDLPDHDSVLAIGLCSSSILANWYLRKFDKAIKSSLRPAYYGRYVDDIFLVIPCDDPPNSEDPVGDVLDRFLVQTGILYPRKGERYELRNPRGLFLQQKKCILQYFDSEHSIAGLDKFKKKIEENGSDFQLLPTDESDGSLDDVAYDLLYDGSINKFRSVKGVGENRYELAKHLAKQIMLHLLTEGKTTPTINTDLLKFFKGRNAIAFHDAWERVFTFFKVSNDDPSATALAKQLKGEIDRLEFGDQSLISKLLAKNLKAHLRLSRAMAESLSAAPDSNSTTARQHASIKFRTANLLRHHFVRLPLLNYTDFSGSLLRHELTKVVAINNDRLYMSPRYVHFDECLLLAQSGLIAIDRQRAFAWASRLYEKINDRRVDGIEWLEAPSNNAD